MVGKVRQPVVASPEAGVVHGVHEPEDDRRLRLRLGELKEDVDSPQFYTESVLH